jgi:hypothetical protein
MNNAARAPKPVEVSVELKTPARSQASSAPTAQPKVQSRIGVRHVVVRGDDVEVVRRCQAQMYPLTEAVVARDGLHVHRPIVHHQRVGEDVPVTVSFDRVDPGRVVHGLPVRDVRSRAGQRKVPGPLADPVVALPMNGLVHSTLDTPSTGTHAFTDSHVHQSCGRAT